jgi:hypothetical protein
MPGGRRVAPLTQGDDAMAHPGPQSRHTGAWLLVTVLLLIAVLGTLVVPIYARKTPIVLDFPFFYWYQLIWVPVVALLTTICYFITTRVIRSPGGPPSAASSTTAAGGTEEAL